MSEKIHVLAQQLFGKSSIEECNLQEIKNLAERYPYFAPAQFFLLEKMKKENSESYHVQLQKSVLYYHNPLAFEYFISSDKFYTEVNFDEKEEEQMNRRTDEQGTDEGREKEQTNRRTDEQGTDEGRDKEQMNRRTDEQGTDEVRDKEQGEKETKNKEQETSFEHEHSITQIASSEELENTKAEDSLQLKTQNSKLEPLSFEPFHTVDYFASQGIKLSQEEIPKDKLGKQLKSFTEWLKTMKRLPANEVSKIDSSTEQKVEHMAEDSVHNADVVTEAMAEVWIKQGNTQKALEVYNKLSLLNPSKKPYFAGLIENLKRS